jgi:hypothetical protein
MNYKDIGHLKMGDMKYAVDGLGGSDGLASYLKDAGYKHESLDAIMQAVKDISSPRMVELWWTEDSMCRIMKSNGYDSEQNSMNHNSPSPDRMDHARCPSSRSLWRGRIDHDMKMISMVIGSAYHSPDNLMAFNLAENVRQKVIAKLKSLHPDYSLYFFDANHGRGEMVA